MFQPNSTPFVNLGNQVYLRPEAVLLARVEPAFIRFTLITGEHVTVEAGRPGFTAALELLESLSDASPAELELELA
jgi:hypothetical protein